ncbi:MAG: hypothetical protein ACLUNZ_10835 [Evtepia sp.]
MAGSVQGAGHPDRRRRYQARSAFEGTPPDASRRESGIESLRNKVDSLVIIPNERLKYATEQKITLANAFEIADDVLRQAVQSISDLIKNTGFINLDFADVYRRHEGRRHALTWAWAAPRARTRPRRLPARLFPARCWRPPSTALTACS